MLAGAPDSGLPEWFTPENAAKRATLDPELVAWLEYLRDIVREQFAALSWPNPASIDVLFDSEHRVRAGGGWDYFR